jgi:hypothetical protein
MMSDSVRRVGGVAAMVLGLTYVAVGVAFFLQPEEQGPGGNLDEFFRSIADGAGWFLALNWAFVIGGVVALAVIPAATGIVLRGNEGWAIWAASLAYLGFAVLIVDSFRAIFLVPLEAEAYMAASEEFQGVIRGDNTHLALDQGGLLIFGAVGLWILMVSALALVSRRLPLVLSLIGLAVAVAYFLVVAGLLADAEVLVGISAGIGGIVLAPIFYIWVGISLWRSPYPTLQSSQ